MHAHLRPRAFSNAKWAPALVLLDNVELGLPLPRVLETLSSLGITALVTARFQPDIPRLRPILLAVPDLSDAMQLFAERYTAAQRFANGDFATAEEPWDASRNEAAVRDVVNTLGCLPLAIELAAPALDVGE